MLRWCEQNGLLLPLPSNERGYSAGEQNWAIEA